jgi:hypothetical protein
MNSCRAGGISRRPLFPLVAAIENSGSYPCGEGFVPEIVPAQGREEEHMNARRWVSLSLVLVALLGVNAFGQQDATKLVWNGFKEKGEKGKFYQEMTTTTTQDMTVMNMKITQEQSQTFWVSWEPLDKDKDGNWTVKQRIEGIKMDITIGGNKISFDSTNAKEPANPLTDFFKALKDAEFTLTIKPDLTVKEIKGRDDFIKTLAKANAQLEPLLKAILSESALKQMFDQSFAVLPPEKEASVKKGSTWTKKDVKLDLGPIGTYINNYTYTFEGIDPKTKFATIKVDTDLKYQVPMAQAGQLPFKITKANLESKPKEATGTINFDLDNGRIDNSNMKLKLEGNIDIEIGGQTTNVQLSQTQTATLKTYATNPLKK